MDTFNEHRFQTQVDAALSSIRTVLDNTRQPRLAADVPHAYQDKYLLAEYLARAAIASELYLLEQLGVKPDLLKKVRGGWVVGCCWLCCCTLVMCKPGYHSSSCPAPFVCCFLVERMSYQ